MSSATASRTARRGAPGPIMEFVHRRRRGAELFLLVLSLVGVVLADSVRRWVRIFAERAESEAARAVGPGPRGSRSESPTTAPGRPRP